MTNIYEKIKMLREEKNLSQQDLAKKVGYNDRSMIAKIESGKVDLTQSKIQLFANALGTSVSFLLGFTDEKNSIDIYRNNSVNDGTYHLQLLNVSAGLPESDYSDIENIEVPSYYKFDYLMEELFAIRVIGESMNKILPDGSIVICKRTSDQHEVKNGDMVVFKKDNEYCIKKYVETDTLLIFEPMSFSQDFKPLIYSKLDLTESDPLEILGVVKYQFNRFD